MPFSLVGLLFLGIPTFIVMLLFMFPRRIFTYFCLKLVKKVETLDILLFNTLGFLIQMLIVAIIFHV